MSDKLSKTFVKDIQSFLLDSNKKIIEAAKQEPVSKEAQLLEAVSSLANRKPWTSWDSKRKTGDVTRTGHDVRTISTGTVYTKRAPAETPDDEPVKTRAKQKLGKESDLMSDEEFKKKHGMSRKNYERMQAGVKIGEEAEIAETVIIENAFSIKIPEEATFEDFVDAAMYVYEDADLAIEIANIYYDEGDFSIFEEALSLFSIQEQLEKHIAEGKELFDLEIVAENGEAMVGFIVNEENGVSKKYVYVGETK